MALRSAYRLARGGRVSATILTTALVAGCGGGNGANLYPEGPKWSLTDKKPSALGAAPGQPAEPAPPQTYEYRGGRDPVTGQARTMQGLPPAGPAERATSARGAGAGQGSRVEIRKGDTLHGLSLQHHVSVKALMEANNLTSTTIIPGKTLVIPGT